MISSQKMRKIIFYIFIFPNYIFPPLNLSNCNLDSFSNPLGNICKNLRLGIVLSSHMSWGPTISSTFPLSIRFNFSNIGKSLLSNYNFVRSLQLYIRISLKLDHFSNTNILRDGQLNMLKCWSYGITPSLITPEGPTIVGQLYSWLRVKSLSIGIPPLSISSASSSLQSSIFNLFKP